MFVYPEQGSEFNVHLEMGANESLGAFEKRLIFLMGEGDYSKSDKNLLFLLKNDVIKLSMATDNFNEAQEESNKLLEDKGKLEEKLNTQFKLNTPAAAGNTDVVTNPLTGAYSCPVGASPHQQGAVTTAVSCGKSCVRSVFTPIYTCMKCGSSALFGGGGGAVDPCGGACDPSTETCVYSAGWTCALLGTDTTDGLFP